MINAIIFCRVSGDKQEKEGTSLETQMEACLKYCRDKGYKVVRQFSGVESGLVLDRPMLNEMRELVRTKATDVVVCYCLDRLTRDPEHGAIIMYELEKYNVILEAVTETVDSTALGKLITYIRNYASKIEAEKIRERTMRGKNRLANEDNKIVSGFGRFNGYLGLRYDKERKMLVHIPGQIGIAAEIIQRGLLGESSSVITRDLQSRSIRGIGGGIIQRSAVSRVLSHAEVYAGVITWNGIKIFNKVENPIITLEEADIISERLKQNRKNSLGFGRRTWLGGRFVCGWCGRGWSIDTKRGCRCNGNDSRLPANCKSPRIGFIELSGLVYGTMIIALSEPESVIQKATRDHDSWLRQKEAWDSMKSTEERQEKERGKRRRQLSFQHEQGGLTDEEYIKRLDALKREAETTINIHEFPEPEPPTPEQVQETYSRMAIYLPLRQNFDTILQNPQDETLKKLADEVDLQVIIRPPVKEGHKYSALVKMNLPVPDETADTCFRCGTPMTESATFCTKCYTTRGFIFPNEKQPTAMVFQSSLHYGPRQRQPPGHV